MRTVEPQEHIVDEALSRNSQQGQSWARKDAFHKRLEQENVGHPTIPMDQLAGGCTIRCDPTAPAAVYPPLQNRNLFEVVFSGRGCVEAHSRVSLLPLILPLLPTDPQLRTRRTVLDSWAWLGAGGTRG